MNFFRWVLLVLAAGSVSAAEYRVLLEFETEADFAGLHGVCQVQSYEQIPGYPIYRCVLVSSLDEASLMAQIDALPGAKTCEQSRTGSLVGLEAAGNVDQRAIMVLDDDPATSAPSTPSLYQQDFQYQTRARSAWYYTWGEGAEVAVLDTGVDYNHALLYWNMMPGGWDFVDEDPYPYDRRDNLDSNGNGLIDEGWGHGTHVAGVVVLTAPDAKILPIRVVDSDGEADMFDILQGMAHAMDRGVDVINLSMSIDTSSPLLNDMIERANAQRIVVVTSAGNNNTNQLNCPANIVGVMVVSSVDRYNYKSPFANFHDYVDVSAPGENVLSALPGGGYVYRSGTSMAAPMVSGQIALLIEWFDSLNADAHDVIPNILYTAENLNNSNPGYTWQLGWGLIDMMYALDP